MSRERILTFPLTESYIDHLVRYLDEHYLKRGKSLDRCAVVFGGKRPALFIKRELAKKTKGSYFPPAFFTINDFVNFVLTKHENFKGITDMGSSYLLYQLVLKQAPQLLKMRKSFAEFMPWTREILSFIEHLDLEDVGEEDLKNLKAHAQIGYAVPMEINQMLETIAGLRGHLHKRLTQERTLTRGLQYLLASRQIGECHIIEFDEVLFCNFFYFHRTEERIVKSLYDRGQATLLFQGDQRFWPVLKRISQHFQCELHEAPQPLRPQFKLHLYSAPDMHTEIGWVGEILKTIKGHERTVIVLPEPAAMIPLLSEVSALCKSYNVSMGYPLSRSSLYGVFAAIFKAQRSRKGEHYYAKDYLRVLSHPIIKNLLLADDAAVTRILVHKTEEILTGKVKTTVTGSQFVCLEDVLDHEEIYSAVSQTLKDIGIKLKRSAIRGVLEQIQRFCFKDWEGINNLNTFADTLNEFLNILLERSPMPDYPLNLNIATKIFALKDEFQEAAFNREIFSTDEIFRIFEERVANEFVAFSGSPLRGMQILGLFETRSLSFDHVIVLDANEGKLPRLRLFEPLIPRDVMISLNLDRLELEEEIQRYQFMRLIASAKEVHLIYQENRENERSRFVEELVWESQKATPSLPAIEPRRANFEIKVTSQKIVIEKTPAMVEALRHHVYSASSLNTYLKDPIEFYYSYVLGLKESEDVLDEPQAKHVGTFIHKLLEEGFRPFINKRPQFNAQFRNRFFKLFEEKFDQTFGRGFNHSAFLLKYVIEQRLRQFLDFEANSGQRQVQKILFLERSFEDTFNFRSCPIRFKYIVDRVDLMQDSTVMIIDYKTGGVNLVPQSFAKIAQMKLTRTAIEKNIKSFQLPLYYRYLKKVFADQPVNAALYNLRTMELSPFVSKGDLKRGDEIIEAYDGALEYIIDEIQDVSHPFEASSAL